MDSTSINLTPSQAHPETMDFLSRAWCDFAVQALQPDQLQDRSIILVDTQLKTLGDSLTMISPTKMDDSMKMESPECRSLPPWKSDDLKSWIWMQQAMHPELNYNSCFRKKWVSWNKIVPFKNISIKKWLKELKLRRKDEVRLQKAEVHAAISVAGVAAALAAIAAEKSNKEFDKEKEAAIASAAALVAMQCAKVAEAIGAKKEQLSSVMNSAMNGTTASDIVTLTAAAATSLKGAATLKARSECKNRPNGSAPVLPIEDNNDLGFDFGKGRSNLAEGMQLYVETPEGNCVLRSVSVFHDSESQVVLRISKLGLLKGKKESIVHNLHTELYKNSNDEDEDPETCYLLVLSTSRGMFKLDMDDDYQTHKMWATTINQMLILSSSLTKYELNYSCKNY